jgi:hypothetical protein
MFQYPEPPINLIIELLKQLDACPEAIAWAQGYRTFGELWRDCPHTEWMLWFLEQLGYKDERKLRLFAITCARHHDHLLIDIRSKKVIEVAENFAEGKVGREELKSAWKAGRVAAVESIHAPTWSMALASAQSAAVACARSSALNAAKDASKNALRAAAWNITSDVKVAGEEAWQTDRLRQILADDLPVILLRAKQKMSESGILLNEEGQGH